MRFPIPGYEARRALDSRAQGPTADFARKKDTNTAKKKLPGLRNFASANSVKGRVPYMCRMNQQNAVSSCGDPATRCASVLLIKTRFA